jgi:hypothetical protein
MANVVRCYPYSREYEKKENGLVLQLAPFAGKLNQTTISSSLVTLLR